MSLISTHLRSLGIDCTAHQLRHSFGGAVYMATHDIYAARTPCVGKREDPSTRGHES